MTAPDDPQWQLTRDALLALSGTDFALAGAGAIREHGLTNRPTRDIDLFTSSADADRFAAAIDRLRSSLIATGHAVDTVRRAATFARLQVSTPAGTALEVDLAADWRSTAAVLLTVGPVLALPDAVGSKIGALYNRAETRDFLDVDAIRESSSFSDDELLEIAEARDPGFNRAMFAGQLGLVRQLTASEAAGYGVSAEQLTDVQQRLKAWAEELRR